MKPINRIIIPLVIVITLITACSEDFLDRPSLSRISAENFYQTKEELRLATAALYGGKPWSEWNYLCYLPMGDVLSGNMAVGWWGDAVQLHTFSITGMNGINSANWKSLYKVIAHCNVTINAIKQNSPASLAEQDKNAAIAEARFIRGFAYYKLAIQWGDVPIIEDNAKLFSSPLVNLNPAEDVYQFAVNDLTFAAKHLPAIDTKGRLTTWSAQGMLAKVYLTLAGFHGQSGSRNQALLDSAKVYAGNVCINSGLNLMENYADLFKTQYNDNPESLFALQWVAGAGWLEGNMLQVYSSGGKDISPNGDNPGWFGIAPTYDMYTQYSSQDSIRRKATFMLKGDRYPELNAAGGGYTFNGSAGMKKHIIGTTKDNNAPTMNLTSSTEHNSLLRLADVYLIYVEAILGNNTSTSDENALTYFNRVRTRAGLDPVETIHVDSLFKERRIELAAEGIFWEDLKRLYYYKPAKAISFLTNQERVTFTYDDGVATKGEPYGAITPASAETFKLPLPSSEITANPKFLEEPVPYQFEE